jgi:hypothetical protein
MRLWLIMALLMQIWFMWIFPRLRNAPGVLDFLTKNMGLYSRL